MAGTGGRIPENFIQSLLEKTDIVSVIQESSIKLKKTGANYSACCPFHQEKTPSFTVSQTKQFYHCFGCSAHGDAIEFLIAYQSLTFVEAIERLASRLGLTVPKDPEQAMKAQMKLTTTMVLNRCATYYADQLKNHPLANKPVAYLKKRGLTGQVAKQFNLGFAPPGWDNLLRFFQEDKDALGILEETGLIIKHPQKHYYDRFRDRIMFPIRDRRGDVIGFGARVMDKSQPKYLNSPESSIFQKGHCLYGLHEAIQEKWQTAIVVEGYLDVVALVQMGVHGVIATLGTAITSHHLNTLFHSVNELVFCFDGDKAGRGAAWKALQLVLSFLTEQRQIRFVFLPPGEDPDSYVRQYGAESFHGLVTNGTPLSEYFFATLCEGISINSVDGRAHLANMARPMIEKIPPGIFKEMMFEQLAKLVASSPQVVRGGKAFRSYYSSKRQISNKVSPPPKPMETAYVASALLLRIPTLYSDWEGRFGFPRSIVAPGMALFYQIMTLLNDRILSTEELRQKLQERAFDLKRLEECEKKVALLPKEGLAAEFKGAVSRLEVVGREQIAEKLLQKAKNMELSEEEKLQLKEFLQSRESIN